LITEYLGWRWIFYVNLPIGLGAILTSLILLPRTHQRIATRFDPLGALLLGVGVGALTLGLSFGEEWGWTSTRLVGVLGTGLVALLAAVLVERRVPAPVVDLGLFRNRVFVSALVSLIFAMLALFAVSFLMPFYFEDLRGYSTVRSGLLLTPLPLTVAVIAPLAGAASDRFGSRWLSPLGLVFVAIGLALLSQLNASSSIADVVWRLIVVGIGQALFVSPNANALMGAAPSTERGESTGLQQTGRVMGQAVSVAVAGAVFTTLGGAAAGATLVTSLGQLTSPQIATLQRTFVHGFQTALLVCAAFSAVGVLTALVRGQDHRPAASGTRINGLRSNRREPTS
jgi:MFS family permease